MLLHVIKPMQEDGSGAAACMDNRRFVVAGGGEDRQRLQQDLGMSFTRSPLLSVHMEAALIELCSGLLQHSTAGAIPPQHRCSSPLDMAIGVEL